MQLRVVAPNPFCVIYSQHDKLLHKDMTLKSLKAKLSALSKERVRLVQANSKQTELMSRFQLDYYELAQQIEVVCYYTACVLYRQAYDVKYGTEYYQK